MQLTTHAASSPSGLNVEMTVPQEEAVSQQKEKVLHEESFTSLAEADLKEAVVTLPAGMSGLACGCQGAWSMYRYAQNRRKAAKRRGPEARSNCCRRCRQSVRKLEDRDSGGRKRRCSNSPSKARCTWRSRGPIRFRRREQPVRLADRALSGAGRQGRRDQDSRRGKPRPGHRPADHAVRGRPGDGRSEPRGEGRTSCRQRSRSAT